VQCQEIYDKNAGIISRLNNRNGKTLLWRSLMFYKQGKNIGLIYDPVKKTSLKKAAKDITANLTQIKNLYNKAMKAMDMGFVLPSQYEWLCDNFYIIGF